MIFAPNEDFQHAWEAVADRYEAYTPVWPGEPAFLCQAQECDAYCCRTMSVSLDDDEAAHMASSSGREPVEFLECENGEPIALPLLKPYLLARRDAHCAMLTPELSCGEYEGRPGACRQYPYQVLLVDAAGKRHAWPGAKERDAAIARTLAGGPIDMSQVAFLVRHTPCPGFTGDPIDTVAWDALFRDIAGVQFGHLARPAAL